MITTTAPGSNRRIYLILRLLLAAFSGVGIAAPVSAEESLSTSGFDLGSNPREAGAGNDFFKLPILGHVLDRSEARIAQLRKELQYLMSLSDEAMLMRLPVQTPRIHNGCPNCRENGVNNNYWDQQQPHCFGKFMGHDKVYDPRNPNQYICPECKEIYPQNQKYPLDQKNTYLNWAGEAIEIRSHLYRDKKGRTHEYFLEGVLDTERHHWISEKMYQAALLYHLTGDEAAGRTALVILNGYADRFPHWLFTTDYGKRYAMNSHGYLQGRGIIQTREGRREYDEINGPNDYLRTVDLLLGTKALRAYEKELGVNLGDKLWDNVIRLTVERMGQKATYSDIMLNEFGQNCPVNLVGLARIFMRPEMIRQAAIRPLDYTPRVEMGIDGSFMQGTGYGQIHLNAMRNMTLANGYSDPPGFNVPRGEAPIQNYRYPYGPHEAYWMKAYNFLAKIRMPNGGLPVINEGEHVGFISSLPGINVPIRKSRDVIAHGLGYAILGDGNDDEQIQVHLNYSPNNVNHGQQDTLTFQMFAFGHYLMDDSEYTKNSIRRYTSSTAGHNTVVIDHKSQGGGGPYDEGSPVLYDGRSPGIKVISVDAARAYKELGAKKYQRTLILNTYELDRPYVVDIFQVQGGTVRDYMLHSSYQHESLGYSTYRLRQQPADFSLLPQHLRGDRNPALGYPLFSNIKEGDGAQSGIISYVVKAPWEAREKSEDGRAQARPSLLPYRVHENAFPGNPMVGTRHHIVGMPGQKVYFFDSPNTYMSIYQGRGNQTDFEAWAQVPHTMLRSTVEDPDEETIFAVVHEPCVGNSHIRSVKKLAAGSGNLFALQINFDDRVDTVFFSTDGSLAKGQANGIDFSGRVGVFSEKGDQRESYLLGGQGLRKASLGESLLPNIDKIDGEIIRSYRKWNGDGFDGFSIRYSGPLPEFDSLQGAFAVVSNQSLITNLEPENFQNLGFRPIFYYRMGPVSGEFKRILQNSGGGWGFVIDRVEPVGDTLMVYTQEDHGLEVQNGTTREFSFPMREFADTGRLAIYPAIASQTIPEVNPPGGAFMQPVRVELSSPVEDQEILYAIDAQPANLEPAWLPNGQPILRDGEAVPIPMTLQWEKYTSPLTIDRSAQLWVKGTKASSIREQLPSNYNFSIAEDAPETPLNLQPGLQRVALTGSTRESVNNDEKFMEGVVHHIDAEELVDACITQRMRGTLTLTGYLKIRDPGVYTFYYHADSAGDLYLGGRQFIQSSASTTTPVPYAFELPLKQGYLLIKIVYHYLHTRETEHMPGLSLEWITPDGRREAIPRNALFNAAPEVQTLDK